MSGKGTTQMRFISLGRYRVAPSQFAEIQGHLVPGGLAERIRASLLRTNTEDKPIPCSRVGCWCRGSGRCHGCRL